MWYGEKVGSVFDTHSLIWGYVDTGEMTSCRVGLICVNEWWGSELENGLTIAE